MSAPKVSIVIPIFNVEKYLRECLDSVVNQTLKDIEIICVDDGSTDSSPDIIREYMDKDPRVKVITKPNTGYGNSMNRGFDFAEGEYLGIVESDDFAEPEMFEKLYARAKKYELDVVKSAFWFYWSKPEPRNEKFEIVSELRSGVTFCPARDFKAPMEMVDFFNLKPSIWSAIYRKEFIRKNNIRFNETPGASYQDASFNFRVMATAKRVQLVPEAYLHYRQDNETSSVNNPAKVYCVCDEYEFMQQFLDTNPPYRDRLECVNKRIKYDSYMWNLDRIAKQFKYAFVEKASEEFKADFESGKMNKEYFEDYKWKDAALLAEDPELYFVNRILVSRGYNVKELTEIRESTAYKVGRLTTMPARKAIDVATSCKEKGIFYTFELIIKRIGEMASCLKDRKSR